MVKSQLDPQFKLIETQLKYGSKKTNEVWHKKKMKDDRKEITEV